MMTESELFKRLAVALAIGILTGIERGWHTREEADGTRAAGFRTFSLSGLFGGVSAAIASTTVPEILGLLFIGFSSVMLAFAWLEARRKQDFSATTVVAALLTYALGAYAILGDLRITVACAVALVSILALREPLHRWVASLRSEEIRAVLILLAMTFLLLPLLPNRTIDPWGVLNPAQVWLLAIMIAAISFGGYIAVRLFGDRLGIVMAAVAGGLASSTATTLTFARLANDEPGSARVLSGAILVAGMVMAIRVGAVATLLNHNLLIPLLIPLAVVIAILAASAALLLLRKTSKERPALHMANPLELGTAIKLAIIISVVLLATEIVRERVGAAGVLLIAALSGLADVDAVTISMARASSTGLNSDLAAGAILLAVGINTLAKATMAASIGGRGIGKYVGAASAAAVVGGIAAVLIR